MTFCPNCGAERKEGSKFCHNCGYDFNIKNSYENTDSNSNSKTEQNTDFNRDVNQNINTNPQYNQNTYNQTPTDQNSHGIAKVLGYIFAILIPVIGIIIGVYMLMSDNPKAKKHGKIIIVIGVLIQALSMISLYF